MKYILHIAAFLFFWLGYSLVTLAERDTILPPSLTQLQNVNRSPRTRSGRKNLQYEFDLHPDHAFQHLFTMKEKEQKLKRKRRIELFRDVKVFDDEL